MTKHTNTRPNIPILYEDNHLLVIDKPIDVLSQEDHSKDADVLTLCKSYIKKAYNKPGNVFLGLVHRLDRPVSGVMVLAKTSKAASRLSEQVRNRSFKKTYWAIVEGQTENEGRWIHHLHKDKKTNTVKAYNSDKGFTKKAELTFTTLKQSKDYSLVEVDLLTGRPHQIRVQFAKMGHPLWGDTKYGSTVKHQSLALRSMNIGITHPTQKEALSFDASVPKQQPWNMFEY